MWKWLPLVVLAFASVVAFAQETLPVQIKPDDPRLYYTGRIDRRDPAGPRMQWSGSMVTVRFKGTSLQVAMTGGKDQYYEVVTDGATHKVINPQSGTGVIDLAKGLPNTEHTIQVMKRTEAHTGVGQIAAFHLNAGGELLEPQKLTRRIEVIGDSISCGYGNESLNEKEHYVPAHQNAWMTYGAITARELGAEYHCIAWSGRKMWPDNTIPSIYDLTLPTDTTSKWDFAQYQPDVVLINLATNDFGKGAPDEVKWTGAYKEFLKRVRTNYPGAVIYIASGSMMSDAWPPEVRSLTTLKRYLQRIEDEMKAEGETKVRQIHFDPQDGTKDGLGGDWHPSIRTQQKMAKKWIAALEADLGWKPAK